MTEIIPEKYLGERDPDHPEMRPIDPAYFRTRNGYAYDLARWHHIRWKQRMTMLGKAKRTMSEKSFAALVTRWMEGDEQHEREGFAERKPDMTVEDFEGLLAKMRKGAENYIREIA